MASKDLVNRKPKQLILDKELAQWLEKYSNKTKIPQGRIVDEALKLYISYISKN